MRAWLLLAAALAGGVVAASARASARPIDAHDRALIARAATYEERIAEQVSKRLTAHDVSVRCGNIRMANPNVTGVTLVQAGRSFDYFLMRPTQCTYLAWFRQSPARWDPRSCAPADCPRVAAIVNALATVAHESYHILGYTNEAQVECYGMQSIWFVANRLGAAVAQAQAIAAYYAQRVYPRRQLQTPEYWSAECRDGGRYDLRRTLARWPS